MFRIIVIDDETTIRKGLIGYIDWKSLNCVVVNDFENGLQAIDYLKNNTVDIIISDIKMPGADGIEVAKYVHQNHVRTRTILYTGYSDFEYAKSAIEYNVSDFIVKPSTMENIINTVKKNIKEIKEQLLKDSHLENLEAKLEDIHEKEKLTVIKDFVSGIKIDPSNLEKILNSYNIKIERFCLLLYKIRRIKPINHAQTIQFINLSLNDLDQYTFILNDTTYGTLAAFDDLSIENPIELLRNKSTEINDFATNYINGTIFIGISNVHNSLTNAPIAFMEAQRCLDNSFYSENPLTIYAEFDGPKENPTDMEHNLEKITQYLNKDNEALAIETIKTMFIKMSDEKEPVDYIKSIGIAIYTICMNVVHRNNLKSSDVFQNTEPYQKVLAAEYIDDLIIVLCEIIHQIIKYLSEGNNNYLIKKVNIYMLTNYKNPIKLDDIAKHVHINSSYLSRLYRDKTNQTITQTLRNIRIEKAKKYLAEGQIKTYEIAVLVGFDDPGYFSYAFKQETGISPSQYKNKNLL